MSRDLEAGADAALQAAHVDEVVFLEFDLLSGTSRVCSREHSVEWNGYTWAGAGLVGSIEALSDGGELEARGIAMTLSGLPAGVLATALTPAEYKGRAVRMWCGQMQEARYLSLPGTSGNYASTPDSAAVSVTGDIDIRVKLAPNSWGTGVHQAVVIKGSHDEFGLFINPGPPNSFQFYRRISGAPMSVGSNTHAFANGQPKWIKVTRVAMSGVGNFYHSDDGMAWTAMGGGTDVGGVSDDSAATLNIGFRDGGGQELAGKIYYAELRNGIDGPVVAKFDASLMSPRQINAQMPTGEVWTINQSGTPNAHIERDAASIAADPVGPFLFKMDQLKFQLGSTAAIRLTAEGRLADWMRSRVRRYNNADHQVLHPGDKFFENVEKQVEAVHLW